MYASGNPSPVLEDRLATALELYRRGAVRRRLCRARDAKSWRPARVDVRRSRPASRSDRAFAPRRSRNLICINACCGRGALRAAVESRLSVQRDSDCAPPQPGRCRDLSNGPHAQVRRGALEALPEGPGRPAARGRQRPDHRRRPRPFGRLRTGVPFPMIRSHGGPRWRSPACDSNGSLVGRSDAPRRR